MEFMLKQEELKYPVPAKTEVKAVSQWLGMVLGQQEFIRMEVL